jgi:hypothetical protein
VGDMFFSCCVEEGGCGVHGTEGGFGCSWDEGEGALGEHFFVFVLNRVGMDEMEWRLAMDEDLMCIVGMLESKLDISTRSYISPSISYVAHPFD